MDLSPPFLPTLFLLLGDVDPTKDCAWDAGVEGGIREARRRLVWCGTLSLKYPEVFFPRNCRSLSFLGSLNGPGYPGRIEKLPLCSISLFFLFSLLSTCPFCSQTFFFSVSAREAIYTRLRLANSRPLLDDDKVPWALRTRPILHAQPRVSENILHCPRVKNHKEHLRNAHQLFASNLYKSPSFRPDAFPDRNLDV